MKRRIFQLYLFFLWDRKRFSTASRPIPAIACPCLLKRPAFLPRASSTTCTDLVRRNNPSPRELKRNRHFSYAGDFVNGTLSLSDLSEAMRLGKLGEQVVLKSKKAFEAITFVETIKAPRQEYFAKYRQRDEEARGKYRQIAAKPMAENEIYVISHCEYDDRHLQRTVQQSSLPRMEGRTG